MAVLSPKLPSHLAQVDDFSSYVREFLIEELPIHETEWIDAKSKYGEFRKIDIRKSRFINCVLTYCDFEKASFIDVIFEACDFSNSKFTEAYFERCQFIRCKCIGVDMSFTMSKNTKLEQSNFTYSSFNQAKLSEVFFDQVDFSEASMGEAKLKKFATKNSLFIKTNFFQTLLAGVDFTGNELIAPMVSSPPWELKGMIIDQFQEAELIGLLGVIVKDKLEQ